MNWDTEFGCPRSKYHPYLAIVVSGAESNTKNYNITVICCEENVSQSMLVCIFAMQKQARVCFLVVAWCQSFNIL